MKKVFLIALLSSLGLSGFSQSVLRSYVYKKVKDEITFTRDTTIVKINGNNIFYNNHQYKVDSSNLLLNNNTIGHLDDASLTIDLNLYKKIDDQDRLNWHYVLDNKTVLASHYHQDEADIISIGFIVPNDSIENIERLEVVALQKYSTLIKPKVAHDKTYLYVFAGILHSIVTFILVHDTINTNR